MKKIIPLTKNSFLLNFILHKRNPKALLIVPNSAGYYAESPKYGKASERIDKLCEDLAEKYDVYYLVLPGQDLKIFGGEYSYTGSINRTAEAINLIIKEYGWIGIIGMCTGSVIAIESLRRLNIHSIPLIMYNTASEVGWSNYTLQKVFLRKYGEFVNLDCEELLKNAPGELIPIINKYQGEIFQIISGNSDYRESLQREIFFHVEKVKKAQVFKTMSDAPISESDEYLELLKFIFDALG